MKIVIDIPEEVYGLLKYFEPVLDTDYKKEDDVGITLTKAVLRGTPLPEGAEILTKESYSDLCMRAADVPNFESEKYVEKRLENYNKLLKSGILDCVKEKPQESEDNA